MTSAFISHVSEEALVAKALKDAVVEDFLGQFSVYASSDTDSIWAGDEWLVSVRDALSSAHLVLVLCSPSSIQRPWVNFEAGAAWILDRPIVPLCHRGLTVRELPVPLSLRQGLAVDTGDGVRALYDRVAQLVGCRTPNADFERLAARLREKGAQVPDVVPDREQLNAARGIRVRLRQSLTESDMKWRSLERLAAEAAVGTDMVADLLRGDPEVRFSRSRSGKPIVGLIDRVGR